MSNPTMTTRDVLIAAKALIDTKDKWFGGDQIARPDSLCILWAIYKANSDTALEQAAIRIVRNVLPQYASGDIADYNDTHTHSACMRLMDRAIEAAS